MQRTKSLIAIATAAFLLPLVFAQAASAAVLSANEVLSDPRPSATGVSYTLNITSGATTTANAVKCVVVQFNDTADMTGSIPTGMSGLGSATLSGTFTTAQALSTFTPNYAAAATGTVKFTNATGGTGTNGTIILSGVTNGSTPDNDFYISYTTFNNTDCTSSPQDNVKVASIWTNGTTATIFVEPSLTYVINAITAGATCNGVTTTDTSTSTAFDLHPTLATNRVAGQRHDISTNASGGYSLYMRHSQLPTSGTNNIDALTGATYAAPATFSAAGTEAWGYTTADATLTNGTANRFTSGGAKWSPLTTSVPGDDVADATAPVVGAGGQTQVCFQTGVGTNTAAGQYVTSIIYTAVGNF